MKNEIDKVVKEILPRRKLIFSTPLEESSSAPNSVINPPHPSLDLIPIRIEQRRKRERERERERQEYQFVEFVWIWQE
jgi:hypothetical protein